MSFPQLLMNRELGLIDAQLQIKTLDKYTARNLANDNFHSDTILLPKNSFHNIFHCQNLVAVLSMYKTDQKIQSLSLWSLITKCKLWSLKICEDHTKSHTNSCQINEYGIVLFDDPFTKCKKIVLDGKESGVLPAHDWRSIVPVGMHILGFWAERHDLNVEEPCLLPENTNLFFGEYDYQGKSLKRYQLDFTRGRRSHTFAYDENFWVRISGSYKRDFPSIIEVVDRVIGKLNTFHLPLKSDEEKFSSACIVENRLLFFGKNTLRPYGVGNIKVNCDPTICIFDLIKDSIIEEFPTGAEKGEINKLVATQHYAAWLEYNGGKNDRVKYLDILNKTINDGTNVPSCADDPNVILSIVGTILSVVYAEGSRYTGWSRWRRKVIDMTNGELKCDIRYERWGGCSIANGIMLINENSTTPRIYIESFLSEGISNKEPTLRDNPK